MLPNEDLNILSGYLLMIQNASVVGDVLVAHHALLKLREHTDRIYTQNFLVQNETETQRTGEQVPQQEQQKEQNNAE